MPYHLSMGNTKQNIACALLLLGIQNIRASTTYNSWFIDVANWEGTTVRDIINKLQELLANNGKSKWEQSEIIVRCPMEKSKITDSKLEKLEREKEDARVARNAAIAELQVKIYEVIKDLPLPPDFSSALTTALNPNITLPWFNVLASQSSTEPGIHERLFISQPEIQIWCLTDNKAGKERKHLLEMRLADGSYLMWHSNGTLIITNTGVKDAAKKLEVKITQNGFNGFDQYIQEIYEKHQDCTQVIDKMRPSKQ